LGAIVPPTPPGVIFQATQKTLNNPPADRLKVPYTICQLRPGEQIRLSEVQTIRQKMTQTCVPSQRKLRVLRAAQLKVTLLPKENVKNRYNPSTESGYGCFHFHANV
jgi:hypothetical protein